MNSKKLIWLPGDNVGRLRALLNFTGKYFISFLIKSSASALLLNLFVLFHTCFS